MIYFTADLHFGDATVLGGGQRPFATVRHMNDALIDRINERVIPRDTLYILGDFACGLSAREVERLRARIACKHIRLVLGNHDDALAASEFAGLFERITSYEEILPGYFRGTRAILSHYPMLSWNGKRRGSIMLHGHIHSSGAAYNRANRDRGVLRYDVGVDANGYAPVSRDEVLAFFKGAKPRNIAFSLEDGQFAQAFE